jgi:hypothetical protein
MAVVAITQDLTRIDKAIADALDRMTSERPGRDHGRMAHSSRELDREPPGLLFVEGGVVEAEGVGMSLPS